MSHQAVNHWEKGQHPITEILADAIEKHHGISSGWLLTGDGEMMVGEPKGDVAHVDLDDQLIRIPLLAFRPCAGHGNSVQDYEGTAGSIAFEKVWLRRTFNVPPANLRLMEVEGDSMKPTIEPGELIFVDVSPYQDFLREGLWVISIDGLLCVKRLKRTGPNQYQAHSDNPNYSPISLDEYARPLARVVGGPPGRF